MKRIFAPYCLYLAVLLVVTAVFLALYPKLELHLMMNSVHTHSLDVHLAFISKFAEWPFYVVALLPLLFWRAGWTYLYATTEAISGLLIFIVKHIFDMPRPILAFSEHPEALHLVPGVHLHSHYSFPSGHTASFFVFYTIGALLLTTYYYRKNKRGEAVGQRWLIFLLIIVLACVGGYARIYLSQHFLMDVFAGCIIGTVISILCFYWFYTKGWMMKQWFNRSLFGKNAYFRSNKSKSEL